MTQLSSFPEYQETKSLSDAADEYYNSIETPNENLERLLRRLDKQKERLDMMTQEEKNLRSVGDYIYEHYQEVENAIEEAKKGKGKLNKKDKTVEVEI